MKLKMRIYEFNDDNSVAASFIREYDDDDIIKFVRHALIEEGKYEYYDIDIEKVIIE
jgi:hypothetical protein